jgi:hypothetical protein
VAELRRHNDGAVAAEIRRSRHHGLRIAGALRDLHRVEAPGIEVQWAGDRQRTERVCRIAGRQRAAAIDRGGGRIEQTDTGQRAARIHGHARRAIDRAVQLQRGAGDGGRAGIGVGAGQDFLAAGDLQTAARAAVLDDARERPIRIRDDERVGAKIDDAGAGARQTSNRRRGTAQAGNIEDAIVDDRLRGGDAAATDQVEFAAGIDRGQAGIGVDATEARETAIGDRHAAAGAAGDAAILNDAVERSDIVGDGQRLGAERDDANSSGIK